MWLISFMWFKQNCTHLEQDYDFDKESCRHKHDTQELFAVDPETKKKYYHHPCKEKYCPILQICEQVKR